MSQPDPTNPTYYSRFKPEPIDVIEALELPFCVGNLLTYILRYDQKNSIEDLHKARWYALRLMHQAALPSSTNFQRNAQATYAILDAWAPILSPTQLFMVRHLFDCRWGVLGSELAQLIEQMAQEAVA